MSALTNGADDGADGELVPVGPPPTLRWNLWATAVWSGLTILSNLVLFGERPYLRKYLIDQNADAKSNGKKYTVDYTAVKVDHDVHNLLVGGLIRSLLVVVILLLLALLTLRGRSLARWGLLAMGTVPGIFLGVGVLGQLVSGAVLSSPGIHRLTVVAAGAACLVVIVLLLHRSTRAYFAALRETQRGKLPAVPGSRVPGSRKGGLGSAGARPAGGGLGALFAPRRRPAPTSPPDQVDNAAPAGGATVNDTPAAGTSADGSSGATASRRPTATRPGSVKAKGSGNRPGRFKSRQQ